MTEYTDDEDPYRLIFSYTTHIKVPKWVDEKLHKDCFHCKEKMSVGEKHNCRLCGGIFCDRCSGKYHIPLVFELKGKKGPTRVCYGCRDSCVAQRKKEQEQEKNPTTRGSVLTLVAGTCDHGLEIAPPLEWADPVKISDCKKCRKKTLKPRNCRLCGKCFCDKCSSKMSVPICFEKKQKTGPARVCDACRYQVYGGAKLVDKLSSPPLSAYSSPNRSFRALSNKPGFFATHAGPSLPGVANKSTAASNSITIQSEEEFDSVSCHILITSPTMSLTEIDGQFKRVCPLSYSYVYVYREQVIPDTFYDMFKVSQLGNIIHIRRKQTQIQAALSQQYETPANGVAAASSASTSESGGAAISNPWKSTENALQQEAFNIKSQEFLNKPKFHKPIFNGSLQVDSIAKPNLAKSTGLSGLSKKHTGKEKGPNLCAIPAGKTIDDLFRLRAAQLFVAKE